MSAKSTNWTESAGSFIESDLGFEDQVTEYFCCRIYGTHPYGHSIFMHDLAANVDHICILSLACISFGG